MNRIFVYIGIIAGLLLGGSLSVEAQKKPLDIEACTSWKRIDAPDISPTGRWVTYRISLMEYNPASKEEKKLHLFDSRTRKEILLNGDIERLETLAYNIKNTALCGLGQTAPNPVLSTLKFFRDEYVAHVVDKKCPAGVCKSLLHYEIVADKCKGCTACARACPVNAISGEVRKPHQIDTRKCIKCGACMETCRFDAIVKR